MERCLTHLLISGENHTDKFELGIAVQKVYDFIWDEFCDWYIEIAKVRTYKKDEDPVSANAALWTLKTVLTEALKLLHPYMPFITEEIFCTFQSEEETIMLSKWPEYKEEWNFPAEESAIEHCKDLVRESVMSAQKWMFRHTCQ